MEDETGDIELMSGEYAKLYRLMFDIYMKDRHEGETLFQWYRSLYQNLKFNAAIFLSP